MVLHSFLAHDWSTDVRAVVVLGSQPPEIDTTCGQFTALFYPIFSLLFHNLIPSLSFANLLLIWMVSLRKG